MNLIAHMFYRSAPLNGSFSVPALVIGLAVHLTVASFFGTAIALLAQRLPGSRSLVVAGGVLLVAVVWPVMQWGVWYRLDEAAANELNDWIFTVAHLVFGVAAAGLASIVIADDEKARRARHAARSARNQVSLAARTAKVSGKAGARTGKLTSVPSRDGGAWSALPASFRIARGRSGRA